MRIGIPKEIKAQEHRVALTPAGVARLVAAGHQVIVDRGAGSAIGFSNLDYLNAGAIVVADGARLDIVEVPGSAWCMQCSRSVAIAGRTDPCPECGSWQLQVTGGSEMRVMELELA